MPLARTRIGPRAQRRLGCSLGEDHMLDMSVLGSVADCALTDKRRIAFEDSGLPNTFVARAQSSFFTFAAALAYRRGLDVLIGGMCETDYSGYPDCATIRSRACR